MKIVPGSDGTPLNVLEFEEYAKEYLPKNAYDYYASGADDMVTLRENREAFKRLVLRPRVLRDVSNMSVKTTVLGQEITTPVCVSPTAMQRMAHPDGEVASAGAAAKTGNCYILSSISTTSIEDVATANGDGLRWFQLYVFKDREITRELVVRAEKAGYKAIVLTVDTPLLGHREPDVRNKFHLPGHLKMANFTHIGGKHANGVRSLQDSGLAQYVSSLFDLTLNWEDVKWLKSITSLPVVVKGVLTGEDAKLAVEMGCEGIMVSNHGARQLDGVSATIDALPEIVAAVNGRAEVYLDGGVRRGTDVFKALALGARAVFIGRPVLWGLTHSGEEGVLSVLNILNEELKHAMLFAGTASLADIGRQRQTQQSKKKMALEGTTLKGWKLNKKLGAGACSDVYAVESVAPLHDKNCSAFVMKLSPLVAVDAAKAKNKKRKKSAAERNADALYAEHLMYQSHLRDHDGLPYIPQGAYGEDKGFRFLVMERLGRTLDTVVQENGPIPSATAAQLGLDLLETLQHIHSKNIVYVDVKPENFMLDRHKENRVYIVDFGIADRYIMATGKHKEFKTGAIVGTPTYLSLNCHGGATASRRDDVEALLHVLIYLMRGELPWQNAASDAEGAKIKKETSIKDLCDGLSTEWATMLSKARDCGFEDRPEYDFFTKMFVKLGAKRGAKEPFAWGTKKTKLQTAATARGDASPARKKSKSEDRSPAAAPVPTAAAKTKAKAAGKKAVPVPPAVTTKTPSVSTTDAKSTRSSPRETKSRASLKTAAAAKTTKKATTTKNATATSDNDGDDDNAEDSDGVEFVKTTGKDPRRRRKAAQQAVAAAAAAEAAAKQAENTGRYQLRSRSTPR